MWAQHEFNSIAVLYCYYDFHNKIQGFFVSTQHGIKKGWTPHGRRQAQLGMVMDKIVEFQIYQHKKVSWDEVWSWLHIPHAE